MMPSDKRLHPSSFLFNLGTQAKAFIVPGGVGVMTIAMLLSNTVDAAEARLKSR